MLNPDVMVGLGVGFAQGVLLLPIIRSANYVGMRLMSKLSQHPMLNIFISICLAIIVAGSFLILTALFMRFIIAVNSDGYSSGWPVGFAIGGLMFSAINYKKNRDKSDFN